MDITLVAVNSKYIHTNPAVRSIKYYIEKQGFSAEICEFSGKEELHRAASKIARIDSAVVAFSCYIWNIDYIIKLAQTVKKSAPYKKIVFGGPEAYCNAEKLLSKYPFIDAIISGEGEKATLDLLKNGIKEKIIVGETVELSELGFIYSEEDLKDKNRIFYYESSRGCPYNCSYCLSCITKGVRFKDVKQVKEELEKFDSSGVRLVKFIDRTFNADMKRAKRILEIIKNLSGETEFHIEINPDSIDEEFVYMLGQIKKGRIRVEAGLQSINPDTLAAVNRSCNLERIIKNVRAIKKEGVTIHLDLIAGLPHEDLKSFKKSFNFAFGLYPDELQLGFLKVLPQTELSCAALEYGLVYDEFPPYEIISTKVLCAEDVELLKNVESVVDIYHNSGVLVYSEEKLLEKFDSPFEMFNALADYLSDRGHLDFPQHKAKYISFLYDFARGFGLEEEITKDFFLNIKGGKPYWYKEKQELEKVKITCILSEGKFDSLPELLNIKPQNRHKFIKFYRYLNKVFLVSYPDRKIEDITEKYNEIKRL